MLCLLLHVLAHLLNHTVLEQLLVFTFSMHKHTFTLLEFDPEVLKLSEHIPCTCLVFLFTQRTIHVFNGVFKALNVDEQLYEPE